MSAAADFIKVIHEDTTLQEAVLAADGKVEEIITIGRDAGYEFSRKELRTAYEAFYDELSEEELSNVAGGTRRPVVRRPLVTIHYLANK